MQLMALWVPTLVLMPKFAIAGLLSHMGGFNEIGRGGGNVIKNEAKTPALQVTSHIYTPSPSQRMSFGTASSHELDMSTEGSGFKNADKFDDSFPIHDGLPHDPEIQSPSSSNWRFASPADYQRANRELLELRNVDQSIWEFTEIRNCQKIKPDGLTDFSITKAIKGDGNCQFRAISLIMTGSQEYHGLVRERTVEYMRMNSYKFKPFANYADPGAGGSWEGYLENLKKPTTYGDHLTLEAMAALCRRKFVVLNERSTHDGVDIMTANPDDRYLKNSFLYLNNDHYELLLKDLPSTNAPNLGGSTSFPPTNYRSNQPIRSTSSSSSDSSYSSDSGGSPVNSFQDNRKYETHTMELPKSQTQKLESYITGPTGEPISERINTRLPYSRSRTLQNGGVTSQDRNPAGFYKKNTPETGFGSRTKKVETRPVSSPSKVFKETMGTKKVDLRLRFDTGVVSDGVVNGFFKSGIDIDPSEALEILEEHYNFDSRIPNALSQWNSKEIPQLSKTLYTPPFEQKGTSQFESFSALMGQKETPEELRMRVIQTMIDQREQYEPNIERGTHGSWELYLAYIAESDTPGDHLTLQALADTFGRRIVVVNQGRDPSKVMLQEMAPLKPDENAYGSFLMYQSDQHYGLLI